MEFPCDSNTLKMDDEHMLGPALLVSPVLDSRATKLDVYFPGCKSDEAVWYDVSSLKRVDKYGFDMLTVTMDSIPVFQRGGTIIPRKMRPRRATSLMKKDPVTLFVALDKDERHATGTLYLDDEDGYDYRSGSFAYISMFFESNVLSARNLNANQNYASPTWLERVVVLGLSSSPASVSLSENGGTAKELGFKYDPNTKSLVIRKPGVVLSTAHWNIALK
jgi:alpha 1,3-glucosidase